MPRTPDPALHAHWREIILDQATSGLSIVRYCAHERISTASFHAWKRRLRLADSADSGQPLATPAFLPVTLRPPDPVPAMTAAIEADLPNGVRLRIPTASPRLACRIIRIVAQSQSNGGDSPC